MRKRTWAAAGLAIVLLAGLPAMPDGWSTATDLAEFGSRGERSYFIEMRPDPKHPGSGRGGSVSLFTRPDGRIALCVDMPGQGRMALNIEALPGEGDDGRCRLRISGTELEKRKPHGTVECSDFSISFPDEAEPRPDGRVPAPEVQWKVDRILEVLELVETDEKRYGKLSLERP
jgi:hypothetical protein